MNASDEEITHALEKAEALQFVNNLQEKADTHVGSGGSQLSGGQKQRIAIARVFLKGCRLILMDEATSALDRQTERRLLKTLKSLQQDSFSISITHRKRLLKDCGMIVEF